MKYNRWTVSLCLAASTKKYFKVLMEAVGDQVSQNNSFFWRSSLTKIFRSNLSRLQSYWIFALHTSIHGFTGSPFLGSSTRKVWLLIRFLISFWVTFSQGYFILFDNFVTSAKFIGSRMKWETSEPDYPKSKSCGISFTTVFNKFCKSLPLFFIAFNAPFHSDYLCLIRWRIL